MSFLKKLGLLSLLALVLFAGLLVYLQTRHGFRHVLVPLAATLTGTRLEVQDGSLSLLGELEVTGLLYENPASGISFDAGRVVLRAAPSSFILEGVPRIDELELKQANIRIVHRLGPVGAPVRKTDTESDETLPLMPVTIERARFEDVTVTVEQDDRRITGGVTAALDQLGPGRKGNVTLQTNFLLKRGGIPDLSGTIDLNLSTDVGTEGTPIKWNGTSRAVVRTGVGTLHSTNSDVLNFEPRPGEYEQATLTATMDGAKRPAATDVSLTMAGVMSDTLNLWLGKTAAARVRAEQFDARAEMYLTGTQTSARGKATGSNVRLQSGDSEASPSVDVSLQHAGSFDSVTGNVSIETLTLTIGDNAKILLSGSLDRPVSIHLDRPEGKPAVSVGGVEPAVWSLQLTPSEIQKLRPWLALLGRDPFIGVSAGTLGGELVVSIQEDGAIIDAAGQLHGTDVTLRSEESGRAGLTGPFKLVADWKSRLTGFKLLKLNPLTTSISLKGKQVATLRVTGAWQVGDETGLTALNGTVKLTGLRGETLNPLLGLWSQVRIGPAQFDGHADVIVDERRARWEIDVNGRKVRLRLQDATSDVPPLDLLIKQAGEFDRTTRTLRLDQLGVQVFERRRPVLTLSLDQPLSIHLAQGKEGDRSMTGGSHEAITLGFRINRLGVHQLRSLVALAGGQGPASIQGGALDADLKVRLNGADDVAVAGRVVVEDVTFKRGGNTAGAPITLSTEVRASVIGRSHVAVESWMMRALDGKTPLAQAHLSGSADSSGATDLALDVTTANLSEFVGRLGLLNERQRQLISGGDLKGDVRLVTAGPAKPFTIKGGLRSTNLSFWLDKTDQLTRTISLQADVEVDGARTVAEIQRMQVTVESGAAKAGTLTASGQWPLATTGAGIPAGAVRVSVEKWDSGPFVDFFGLLPGRRSGPLPVTGELKIVQEAGGTSLGLKGKETIGPISVAGKSDDAVPATVHLEQEVTRSGDEIRVAVLSLTAERPKGRADRVTMNGSIRTRPRPRWQLRGNMDAFDADWYAALTSSPSAQAQAGKTPDKAHAPKTEGMTFGVPLDLDVDLAIGSVIYRTLEIGKGRLVAKGDGDRMQATLEPTGLAEGSVQGVVTVAMKGGHPEFGWDAKGNSLDLGILTKAAFAEPELQVTGRSGFTTSGTGRGQGEALRQSFVGTAVFDVADGQFVKSRVLDFLAEQTRIEEFRGFGFRTLHGELQIGDGWVHLNQVHATGPAIALEASGKIGLDGRFDVRVQPKIGPALSDRVRIPCLDQLMKTADGLTVLPVAVTVKGTAENLSYGATVTPGSMVERQAGALVGTIADLLTGCRGGEAAQRTTEEAVGALTDTAGELIENLFGGEKQQ